MVAFHVCIHEKQVMYKGKWMITREKASDSWDKLFYSQLLAQFKLPYDNTTLGGLGNVIDKELGHAALEPK